MPPPFQNLYRLRKVADSDSKSCFICYKPTSTVLITNGQEDFFYVCPNHLKEDQNFCTPQYGPEKIQYEKEIKLLEDKIKMIEYKINDKTKFGTWNTIMKWSEKKKKAEDKDGEAKDDEKNASRKKEKTVDDLRRELAEAVKLKTEFEEKLKYSQEQVKSFILNKDIYKIRISTKVKRVTAQKRVEKISSENFFPSVPPSNLP